VVVALAKEWDRVDDRFGDKVVADHSVTDAECSSTTPTLTLAMTSDRVRPQWYYCLDHKRVEPNKGCRAEVRLGPYKTRQEAAQALEKVEQRNLEWDNDPAWNDDDRE